MNKRQHGRWSKPLTLTLSPALIIAVLLVLTACGGDDAPAPRAASRDAAATPVRVAIAAVETVPFVTRASGSVEPVRRVMPGTKILGRIEAVEAREGDRVERGQLLARFESRDLSAAVAQAEAAVEMAEAQLENAVAQNDRMRDLHSRGSVTDKALEDAATGFRVAQAAVAQAEANLAAARVHLGYAEVRSPLAGWVVAKEVEAGDMTVPGAPLFTLEDLSQVKIDVSVPEAEVVGLAAGDDALVEVLDRRLAATIDRIVPAADPASRTFSVQLLLDNPGGEWKSGMFARVSFEHGERHALRVPASAVVERGQLEGIFVVAGGAGGSTSVAQLRWIKTGRTYDDPDGGLRVEVLSGLEKGERYVTAPPPGLADGAAVEVTP